MANYIINHSDGSTFNVYDLEQNGPNNISTPRQISSVNLSGGAGSNFIKINSDLTYRFIPSFQFDIIESGGNNGTYTVANVSFDGTHTIINISEVLPSVGLPFGNVQYSIPNSENATSLLLSGRGVLNFGQALIENNLHILENFANTVAPVDAIIGQLWYKTDTDELYHFDSSLNWTTSVNLGSGALTFVDPQHPTDQINPILEIIGDDSDVGLSIKTTVDPATGDSILRVLTATDIEALRVEFDGYLSTANSIQSLGTTLVNSFANDLEFANSKGITSVAGSTILSDATGNTWIISNNDGVADVAEFTNQGGSSLLKVKQDSIESLVDFVVDSVNDTLYVDVSAQMVGLGKNNPSEKLDVVGNITYSGQLLSAAGTLLNPGISFAADDSVGLRLAGADILFTIGGSDKLTLKNTGSLAFTTVAYETIVIADNDVPNKKYVDDTITAAVTAQDELSELTDVTITTPIEDNLLAYNTGTSQWINQTPDEANVVSKDGTTLNLGANITYNGGEPLGLPAVPTVDDAAISKTFADDSYMSRITNIPVSKVGLLNYLPLNMTGSYDGAAVPKDVGAFFALTERDGTLVGIRPGHNGNLRKWFYFFSLDGTVAAIQNTDTEYRPNFLATDEYVFALYGLSSFATGFYAIIRNTTNSNTKQYWVFTNGTMDSNAHTFRDVSSIVTLDTSGQTSIQHISEFDLWLVTNNTGTSWNMYDDSFVLLQSVTAMDINNPSYVTFTNDQFSDPKITSSVGFDVGANIQYYVSGNNIRISQKLGLWTTYTTQGVTSGINVLYDYNTIGNNFSAVHPLPHIVDPAAGTINYPAINESFYDNYRDKIMLSGPNLPLSGDTLYTGTHYNLREYPAITWQQLTDNYGLPGFYHQTTTAFYPDDASILGKAFKYTMFVSDTQIVSESKSKFVTDPTLLDKISVSTLIDSTTTTTLSDTVIDGLLPPITSIATSDPIYTQDELLHLSSVIRDSGTFEMRHYDTGALTYSSFNVVAGIPGVMTLESTLPANYDAQIKSILEAAEPNLLTYAYNYQLSFITGDIYVVTYGSYDGVTTGLHEVMTLTLNGGIFTSTSVLMTTLLNSSSTDGISIIDRRGYGVFEDDTNSVVYAIIGSLLNNHIGGTISSTFVLKITNDGISNGQILNFVPDVYGAPGWNYPTSGVHPVHGPYSTSVFNFSSSRVLMFYQDSALVTVQDRTRDSFEKYITIDPIDQLYILTIQPPLGFNIYWSTFPVFLNGTNYQVGTGSLDLAVEYASPENKTFYVYAEIVAGMAQVSILENDIAESNTLIKIGTATTSPTGILTVDIDKVARFDGNPAEFLSTPLSIPIAGADGKIDDAWLSDNVITGSGTASSAKLFFYGFGS